MSWKKKIEDMFNQGILSVVQKLLLVLFYWVVNNRITNQEASDLFAECGFTFTVPKATGQTILTDGTTSYTIVSLITAYHDYFAVSMWSPDDIKTMINDLQGDGFITTPEQTSLLGLGWDN